MGEKTPMMQQIESIPELMRMMEPELLQAVKGFFEKTDWKKYKKVILSGCGDSYCSCLAARFFFMKYTSLDVEVATTMDLSRVYSGQALVGEQDTLVVLVSNSGRVARIVELAKRIRKLGGCVIAITGNEKAGLYQNADAVVKLQIPSFVYAPGIRSYCGCLYALFCFAMEWGQRSRYLSLEMAEKLYDAVRAIPDQLESCMEKWEKQCMEFALEWKDSTSYEWIGSGGQYASAWFGFAKALETTGKPSSAQNTEDWFHMNFFVRDVYHTGTVLCTSKAEGGYSRTLELIRIAEEMGRPLLCITDAEDLNARRKILTPFVEAEELNCFIQYLPAAMLMSDVGDLLGEVYFRDGKENWSACVDCATLIHSEEVLLEW